VLIDHFDPESACRIIEAERVTCAIFVPTLLHRLLAYKGLAEHDLSSLRVVTSFGAILVPEKAAAIERVLKVKVIQGYGASDYGALASTGIDDPEHVRMAGVGRPLTGTELRICDPSGMELPTGTPGRIYARGPHCVGGFVADPVATDQAWHSGFYPMGDFGRLDDEGYLWLAGRARELVIRGGQNIVPAEVEDMILAHPDVAEAAVIGTPDSEMGERVCAVIVPRSGAQLTLEALTDFLRQRGLARFKHPEQLLSVNSMPLNPAATKVDKRALRELLLRP
jgi:non-ribosomal peptide synthetase component E (peptide arylation enzyme)